MVTNCVRWTTWITRLVRIVVWGTQHYVVKTINFTNISYKFFKSREDSDHKTFNPRGLHRLVATNWPWIKQCEHNKLLMFDDFDLFVTYCWELNNADLCFNYKLCSRCRYTKFPVRVWLSKNLLINRFARDKNIEIELVTWAVKIELVTGKSILTSAKRCLRRSLCSTDALSPDSTCFVLLLTVRKCDFSAPICWRKQYKCYDDDGRWLNCYVIQTSKI